MENKGIFGILLIVLIGICIASFASAAGSLGGMIGSNGFSSDGSIVGSGSIGGTIGTTTVANTEATRFFDEEIEMLYSRENPTSAYRISFVYPNAIYTQGCERLIPGKPEVSFDGDYADYFSVDILRANEPYVLDIFLDLEGMNLLPSSLATTMTLSYGSEQNVWPLEVYHVDVTARNTSIPIGARNDSCTAKNITGKSGTSTGSNVDLRTATMTNLLTAPMTQEVLDQLEDAGISGNTWEEICADDKLSGTWHWSSSWVGCSNMDLAFLNRGAFIVGVCANPWIPDDVEDACEDAGGIYRCKEVFGGFLNAEYQYTRYDCKT